MRLQFQIVSFGGSESPRQQTALLKRFSEDILTLFAKLTRHLYKNASSDLRCRPRVKPEEPQIGRLLLAPRRGSRLLRRRSPCRGTRQSRCAPAFCASAKPPFAALTANSLRELRARSREAAAKTDKDPQFQNYKQFFVQLAY